MGSHLWSFQKWFQTDGTEQDTKLALAFLRYQRALGKKETHEIDDDLEDLIFYVAPDYMDEECEQLAKEFITSCYGELIYVLEDMVDQLACLLTGVRSGKRFVPRDHEMGGAIVPCATCNLSVSELIAGSALSDGRPFARHRRPMEDHPETLRLPESRPSRRHDLD